MKIYFYDRDTNEIIDDSNGFFVMDGKVCRENFQIADGWESAEFDDFFDVVDDKYGWRASPIVDAGLSKEVE